MVDKIVHFSQIKNGPFCGRWDIGDETSGRWERVTCPKCLFKRPTESERVKAYLNKKKTQGNEI